MAAVDAAADVPLQQLIERAGFAVARAAIGLLGGTYGRRVIVVAGPGNNGNDGRVAARFLRARGVRVEVRDVADRRPLLGADLVVDAAFGTGFRGTFDAADIDDTPVLAVDIPSGIDGITGAASGRPLRAVKTVTFAALKPGLLFGVGPQYAGEVELVDIGLDLAPGRELDGPSLHLVEASDLVSWVPHRRPEAHKWRAATWIVGGSPGMAGAATLSAIGAQAAGATYVRVSVPGTTAETLPTTLPVETVSVPLPPKGWDRAVLQGSDRVRSVVIGPGLGRAQGTVDAAAAALVSLGVPLVVDADALWAWAALGRRRFDAPAVLTPHDGEFEYLTGRAPGADRVDAARNLAREAGAVVLLKGPTTVIAAPDGAARLVRSGDERLATAGTGDVLSGVIGALLAQGLNPLDAASCGALVHGMAAKANPVVGMRARDLAAPISALLSNAVSAVDSRTRSHDPRGDRP